MSHLIAITNDLFDIASRLKEIDAGYYVVFNQKESRLEVHFKNQTPHTFACAVPGNRLDARTVAHVLRTRRENIDKLVKEIDEANLRLEREQDKKNINDALNKAKI